MMWKRIVTSIIALIGSFIVVYTYYEHEMSAASTSAYTSGGNVTGRIGKLVKGDRLYLYTDNISMQLVKNNIDSRGNDFWFAFSTKIDDTVDVVYDGTAEDPSGNPCPWSSTASINHYYNSYYCSNLRPVVLAANARLVSEDLNFMADRIIYQYDTKTYQEIKSGDCATSRCAIYVQIYPETVNKLFLIGPDVANGSSILGGVPVNDRAFSSPYIGYSVGGSSSQEWRLFNTNGVLTTVSRNSGTNLRYSSYLDFSKIPDVVFSVSKGVSPGIGVVSQLVADPILYQSSGDVMKMRLLNSSMIASLSDIQNDSNESIVKTTKDTTIKLIANGNSGNDSDGNPYTLSAIITDQAGNFKYYQPLGTANGNTTYNFDTTGMDVGKYKVAVVNEAYNESSTKPADASAISNSMDLEIAPPHEIAYTKTPQAGATSGDYEYSKNVNSGSVIGKITLNPTGETPITYVVEADGSDNTYNNFEIDGLDGAGASNATSLNVKIKSNGPDLSGGSLKAGIYKFCVASTASNGYPATQIDGKTRVCTSFDVNKTQLSVNFADPSQTKKSITEATTGWNETATANLSTGTKVTYAKSGGSVGLINIDSDTGRITYAGSGGYGKVEIKATADDDPASGYDNYNPADTTKEIVIYREVDGNVIPHANSSDTTNPTFQTSDANIKPNGIIGNITGTLGTPDNAASGTTTYTYGLKNIDDDNYFSVNPSTGEIKTTADLSTTTGTYHITVTVSDKWSTKELPVTINVGLAGAEDLKFYETTAAIKAITSKSVKVTDTGVNVYATVKGSSNTNPVTYRLKAGEPTNVIDVHPNSGAVTIKGVGTVIIVAEKAGTSGQADAVTELAFTVSAGAQNFIYTDDVGDELPKSGSYYSIYKETYAPNKTFQLYTSGNPTGSSVTYQLKAGSSSDVISVDPSGLVTILNASMNNQKGKVIVQATSHDPSGNYDDKTIELPIDIDKGTRMIAFADHPITVVNGSGSVAPNILADGVLDTSGTAMIEVDVSEDNSIAWTSDGITIQYSWNDVNGKDIKLHVTKPADRNYKEAKAEGTLHILGAEESSLTVSTPGKITYGDHFTIRSTQDDSASSNVQYSFTSDNAVFISAPTVIGNKAEFDAIGNSGSTEITITVTRTADGEVPLTKKVKIKVLPKPITITIDDQTKKRLEDNPPLTFQDITPQLVSWGGVKDNVDTSVLSLSTTAKKYSPIGSYPITCKNYTTLNDNYPNYIFTLKDGLLNVTDNGNKDFWDIDDDGCPDLNIQIKDEEGNTITINGDANEDGIPDYNIDSNGDGKPDLNIDTDKDGKPDVNLVILKEWKPTKCVTLDDIQFSSGISAKAQINIDLDGDLIPDIDIDTKGDFKPHLNISKDGKTPSVNIATIESWKPDQNYNYQGFAYDAINHKPYLNIDTDGDGRPDVNIDLDGDGSADINVDVDGDLIPDVDIDSTGDGKPDINIDTDGDGKADENLMDISQWKPEHNVDQPFEYDTMKIENKNQLEDNGVTVEKPDGGNFLPNMALKVTDVTADKKAEVANKASDLIEKDQEVKQVYEVKLLENGVEVKPDGTLKIRIPIKDGIKNPILLKQKADGTYETINAVMENGYIVYESDELGIVSIIADIDEEQPNPDSEVKGNYYPGNNTGGALTGDTTNRMIYLWTGFASIGLVCLILLKKKQEERN